jgi:uncharacterized membrane protein YbhN (UPF0104 family)
VRRGRGIRIAVGIALAVVVYVVVFPQIASYGDVWTRFAAVSVPWAVALGGGALLDIVVTAPPWRILLPQLSWPAALGFTQASTAVTAVVPGGAPLGMAVSFGLLRRLGVPGAAAGSAIAVAGLWSQVAILVYPGVGAALVLSTRHLSGAMLAVAIASAAGAIAIVLLVLAALRSARLARRLGERLAGIRDEHLRPLLRHWRALSAATVVNHLSGYLLLELSIRAVGVPVHTLSPAATFLGWSIGRIVSTLPLTPAGIGVVELGLIGSLVGLGGPHAEVVAAVLLYRGLIVVPTLAVGFGALGVLGRRPYGTASATSSRESS